MGFIQDMIAVFKKRELLFLEKRKTGDNVYTFVFEKAPDLTWKAGQYGLFSLTHRKVRNGTKPFSIASIPGDQVVEVTTRIGDKPSDFKKAWLELQKGMTIKMSGPLGAFHLQQENRPSLLIAGGIGITPVQAIVKQAAKEGNAPGRSIRVLYLESSGLHLFKDELDANAVQAAIDIAYLNSREELQQEIEMFASAHKNKGAYFVAGPKSMVDDCVERLTNNRISKTNIKKDVFWGY